MLAFAARRLSAEAVGLVFAVRNRSAELDVLPELVVDGLGPADARALLGSAIGGPIDEPSASTARRSTGSAAPACAWRSRALVSSTANGCAASDGDGLDHLSI